MTPQPCVCYAGPVSTASFSSHFYLLRSFLRGVLLIWFGLMGFALTAHADVSVLESDPFEMSFEDAPRVRDILYPEWFKPSFLDLREDLQEARAAGKRGVILYFGQKNCAYCKKLLEENFVREDIAAYTQKYFDVIALDIHGSREVVTPAGERFTEMEWAKELDGYFTPSLLFLNLEGEAALFLRGYYPTYTFMAALEFVADAHYQNEAFQAFISRAQPLSEGGEPVAEDWFQPPPYQLDRSRWPAQRELVVMFEQGDCFACDLLHTDPLADSSVLEKIRQLDVVQLDPRDETLVITPQGKRATAKEWAKELDLFYYPSLLFFDRAGKEILRIDSVVRLYRLNLALEYVSGGGYREQPNFQAWKRARDERLAAEAEAKP
jgi:thioredoxin-related protein